VGERFLRHGGEAARHLDEKNDDDGGQHQRPEELIAKRRAGLRAGGDVADVEEAAHRGEDAEGELRRLLHCFRSSSVWCAAASWLMTMPTTLWSSFSTALFSLPAAPLAISSCARILSRSSLSACDCSTLFS